MKGTIACVLLVTAGCATRLPVPAATVPSGLQRLPNPTRARVLAVDAPMAPRRLRRPDDSNRATTQLNRFEPPGRTHATLEYPDS